MAHTDRDTDGHRNSKKIRCKPSIKWFLALLCDEVNTFLLYFKQPTSGWSSSIFRFDMIFKML